MPFDDTLESLMAYTRWPVKRTSSGYLISYSYEDVENKAISGIDFRRNPPRLITREFDQVPIQFEMIQRSLFAASRYTIFNIYTVGGMYHRQGKPAFYKFTVGENGTHILMGYYKNGLMHRDGLPAQIYMDWASQEIIRDEYGFEVNDVCRFRSHQVRMNWAFDGVVPVYPHPANIQLNNVVLHLDRNCQFHDFGKEPAIQAEQGIWNWDISRTESDDRVSFRSFSLGNVREFFQNGKWTSREGSVLLPDNFPSQCLDMVDLWGGPFYPNPGVRLKVASVMSLV